MSGAVTGYLGVVPSAVVRAEHSESALHPSAPTGDAHLIVALFDAGTGARIQDAAVEAVVRGERHRALRRIRLEPMRINDTVTYGGFVSFARNDRYHVNVIARRPGSEETQLQFVIDARALPRPGG
jgi:hypothetical protein